MGCFAQDKVVAFWGRGFKPEGVLLSHLGKFGANMLRWCVRVKVPALFKKPFICFHQKQI